MNNSLLNWWINYLPLTSEEDALVRMKRSDEKIYNGDY